MQLETIALGQLALRLEQERKLQGLTREQAAAVCGVSTSFIRDAERDPGSCSVRKLVQLIDGLGLDINVEGWRSTP